MVRLKWPIRRIVSFRQGQISLFVSLRERNIDTLFDTTRTVRYNTEARASRTTEGAA
jgi:hypothetical protein